MDKAELAKLAAKLVTGLAVSAAIGATYKNGRRIEELVEQFVENIPSIKKD